MRVIETNEMAPLAYMYGEDVKAGDIVLVWADDGDSAGLVEAHTVKRVYRFAEVDAGDALVCRFSAAKATAESE